MKKWLLPVVLLLALASNAFILIQISSPQPRPPAVFSNRPVHYALYSQKDFYSGLEVEPRAKPLNEPVYGGIVSHHFFAEKEIAKFFWPLKQQNPDTVVIIGPNHFNAGNNNAIISEYAYNTPYGLLEPDLKLAEALVNSGLVKTEEQPFEKEHSISTLVAFVKKVFPRAKLLPIILKKNIPPDKLDKLASELDSRLSANSLVIASVDFSHHLNSVAASFHDDKSIASVEAFDFDSLHKLEIDSPPSIYTLLKYLERRGAQKVLYEHVNSATLSANPALEDVTSYLFAHFLKGTPQSDGGVAVLSFGDAMFDRDIKRFVDKKQNPFESIVGREGNFFKGADFVSINLEGPISTTAVCPPKVISFKFPWDTALLLKQNRVNLANLANNHGYDCGQAGWQDTQKALAGQGISYFGGNSITTDSYAIKKIAGHQVAFLGVNTFSLSAPQEKELLALTADLKTKNDLVIVNVHWGIEYSKAPTEGQTKLAHALIDNGADLIIGHHPHVIQPLEIYKNKAIFYSLGNFIFDQVPPDTKIGLAVGAFFKSGAQKIYLFPFESKNYRPALMPYDKMKSFCDNFLKDVLSSSTCAFTLK